MKKIFLFVFLLASIISTVSAHSGTQENSDFEQAEEMDSGTMCKMNGCKMMDSGVQTNRGMMNMMGGYGMMGGSGWFSMSLLWILYMALAAFVFGIIFWWTYKLVIKEKNKK